jgi:hypothetical protein
VKLGGVEVQLNGALPLTVKDWRELKKRGASLAALQEGGDVETMAILVGYVLEKAGSAIDIDTLTLREMTSVIREISRSEDREEIDRPT